MLSVGLLNGYRDAHIRDGHFPTGFWLQRGRSIARQIQPSGVSFPQMAPELSRLEWSGTSPGLAVWPADFQNVTLSGAPYLCMKFLSLGSCDGGVVTVCLYERLIIGNLWTYRRTAEATAICIPTFCLFSHSRCSPLASGIRTRLRYMLVLGVPPTGTPSLLHKWLQPCQPCSGVHHATAIFRTDSKSTTTLSTGSSEHSVSKKKSPAVTHRFECWSDPGMQRFGKELPPAWSIANRPRSQASWEITNLRLMKTSVARRLCTFRTVLPMTEFNDDGEMRRVHSLQDNVQYSFAYPQKRLWAAEIGQMHDARSGVASKAPPGDRNVHLTSVSPTGRELSISLDNRPHVIWCARQRDFGAHSSDFGNPSELGHY